MTAAASRDAVPAGLLMVRPTVSGPCTQTTSVKSLLPSGSQRCNNTVMNLNAVCTSSLSLQSVSAALRF